jgi:hypothetical protein
MMEKKSIPNHADQSRYPGSERMKEIHIHAGRAR